MKRLSVSAGRSATRPGRFSDGDGLYLLVQPGGGKSWVCRVQEAGNRRDFGLDSASKVSLLQARERAREIARLYADGVKVAGYGRNDVAFFWITEQNRRPSQTHVGPGNAALPVDIPCRLRNRYFADI